MSIALYGISKKEKKRRQGRFLVKPIIQLFLEIKSFLLKEKKKNQVKSQAVKSSADVISWCVGWSKVSHVKKSKVKVPMTLMLIYNVVPINLFSLDSYFSFYLLAL